MKENKLIFRMAARCEAAGRPNNEDNYQVSDNLAESHWGFMADAEVSLGDKGALLVVCDGMGGMNAGEVASAIAVATIKEWFAAEKLTDQVTANAQSIQKYIVEAIQAADAAIKQEGKDNPEHEGMGSTIVLAWLLGQKVYVGWCGDSRAYRYNPKSGLARLSHDHSYVQELVDAGKLTEELAFDHPNNNIITRSLGDPRGKAKPDTKEYDLCNEDIILLCSDGLCGCLRDNEIEDVITSNQTSMQTLRDALWQADEAAGWHDNVTVALAQVLSGGAIAKIEAAANTASISDSKAKLIREKRNWKIIAGCLALLLLAGGALGWYCHKHSTSTPNEQEIPADENGAAVEEPSSLGEDEPIAAEKVSDTETPAQQVKEEKNTTPPAPKNDKKQAKDGNGLLDKVSQPQHKDEENVQVKTANDKTEPTPDESAKENDKVPAPSVKTDNATPDETAQQDKKVEVVNEDKTSVTVKVTE